MVTTGQRRVTEAFVYLEQAATALGTNPAGVARMLRKRGVDYSQTLTLPNSKPKKVVQIDAVRDLDLGNLAALETIGRDWVGTTDAAEVLGTEPPNAEKQLTRRDVKAQFLTVGTRHMRVYPRAEVERVSLNGRRKAA